MFVLVHVVVIARSRIVADRALRSVEQTTESYIVLAGDVGDTVMAGMALTSFAALRLFLLLFLGRFRSTASRSSFRRWRSSSRISLWVGNAVLELLDLRPAVLGLDGHCKDLLVGVDDRVHNRRHRRVVDRQGDRGNGVDGTAQRLEQLLIINVQDIGAEGLTIVVHLGNGHTIGEGRDVQHVEQRRLRGTDLGTLLHQLQILRDFNSTTRDLGGDTQGLEERRLARFHTGVAGRDVHIDGRNGTSTSRSGNSVGQNLGADFLQVIIGEDEANVAYKTATVSIVLLFSSPGIFGSELGGTCQLTLDVRQKAFVLRMLAEEALNSPADLYSLS